MARFPSRGFLALALLLLVLPAKASERVEAMLATVTAEPLAGNAAFAIGFVDFTALYAAYGGDPAGTSLGKVLEQRDPPSLAIMDALLRIYSFIDFLPYLRAGGPHWEEWLGFAFPHLRWGLSPGPPPPPPRHPGAATAPRAAAIEAALAARGLERVEVAGVTLHAKGQEGSIDVERRLPGYPFWGELGSAERLALLPQALVGSRFDRVTADAVTAPRLAGLPLVAAGVRAVDAAGLPGALLQLTLVRDDFSPEYIKALMAPGSALDEAKAALEAQAPGPLPPFGLLVLADRQDAQGEESLVALVYDDAAAAAVAAQTLPLRLAAYRPLKQQRSLLELLGMVPSVTVMALEGKHVVLLRLALDPAAPQEKRRDGQGYYTLLRGLMTRDLGWLTWK